MKIKVKAYAKINLMLDIVSTRNDGYHDLFMIMQSIGVYDTVTVEKIKGSKIVITCNIDDIPLEPHRLFLRRIKSNRKAFISILIKRFRTPRGLPAAVQTVPQLLLRSIVFIKRI